MSAKVYRYYAPEKVCSKEKDRPQLANPFLDVAEQMIVATNGHALVAVPVDVDGLERNGYLAADLLRVGRRRCRKDDIEVEIKDRSLLVPHDIEWPCKAEGLTFPDWKKTLPSFKPGDPGTVTVGLNARLLKQIADALGGEGGVTVTFRPDSVMADEPMDANGVVHEPQLLIRSRYGRTREVGILMPIRLDPQDLRYVPPALPEGAKDDERRAALDAEADVFLRGNGSAGLTQGPK